MVELWLFLGALSIAYLVPGPDMVLLLQLGALQGRGRALAAAAGLALARATHVTLAALGLAALLRTAPWAFDAVRTIGAAYLIWIGIALLRGGALVPAADGRMVPTGTYRGSFAKGLLTNLLNPKALLFCSVLLPQFVHPQSGSVALQFLILGTILVAVGVAFDVLCALVGESVGRWLSGRPLVQRAQRWLFGSLLVAFGIKLAISERPA